MNTKKRIDGDYYIETINATDMVHIASNTEIDGNLTVNGNVTYINTEQLDVKDPFVMVNMSNTATYASNAGLLTHKTATTFAVFVTIPMITNGNLAQVLEPQVKLVHGAKLVLRPLVVLLVQIHKYSLMPQVRLVLHQILHLQTQANLMSLET